MGSTCGIFRLCRVRGGWQGGVLCPQRMVVHAPPYQDLAGSFGGGGGVRKVLCEVLERVQE